MNEIKVCKSSIEQLKTTTQNNEEANSIGNLFLNNLHKMQKCPSNFTAHRFYLMAMSIIPSTSIEGFSKFISLIVSGWLSDLGIMNRAIFKSVPNICPSDTCLQTIMDNSRNCIYMDLAKDISNKIPVSVLSDKGRCGNIDRLTLQAATFDEKNNRVKLRTISADGSHATIEDQTF